MYTSLVMTKVMLASEDLPVIRITIAEALAEDLLARVISSVFIST